MRLRALTRRRCDDAGMATAEFCTGSACAAGVAVVLYVLVGAGVYQDLFIRIFHAAFQTDWFTLLGGLW